MTTIEIYEDTSGEFRWRLVTANGKVVADSAESYKRQKSLIRTLDKLFSQVRTGMLKFTLNGKPTNWSLLSAHLQ